VSVLRVRRERAADAGAVRDLHRAAFAGAGDPPVEPGLVDDLRADPAWLPHLSLVAEVDGRAVGHVLATRAHVEEAPALGVGPVGVLPDLQGRGVGTALLYALIGAAQARDETLLGLLGDPGYYGRFGFGPAADLGVRAPNPAWDRHFMALALVDAPPTGLFRYAAPIERLG
jgi:putative acetyltransferase